LGVEGKGKVIREMENGTKKTEADVCSEIGFCDPKDL